MKRIAVLTSGGDAPGMNAALFAVVKYGTAHGIQVFGVGQGYAGLINGEFTELTVENTEDIIHRSGTILRSARSEQFRTVEGQRKAAGMLKKQEIDGIVVIGGNGSFQGAMKLAELDIPVVGIPATIDNDISGTDYTIGFDTAVNTVIESIDKIKETAYSIDRTIIIEVMGRDSGDIALWSGICTGAESIIIPEADYDIDKIVQGVNHARKRGKEHFIFVVAEGVCSGEAFKKQLAEKIDLEMRVLVLGYLQRGGSPSAYDRMTASKMGTHAVDLLLHHKQGMMVSLRNGKITELPFHQAEQLTHEGFKDYHFASRLLG